MGATTDTRERMIKSAALLLRERGVAGTSIAKVLERSNGPRGSVAFHFPGGRAEILTEALHWVGALVTDKLERERAGGASPADIFDFLCDFYKKQLSSTDFVAGCPVGATAQEAFDDPTLGPVVAEILEAWTGTLVKSLEDAGRPKKQARELALFCICSLEGAIMIARVQQSTVPIEIIQRQLLPQLQ